MKPLLAEQPQIFLSMKRHISLKVYSSQWWANLDQAPEDLDKTIFRDLSPTPKP
jgi:hypothetical protein